MSALVCRESQLCRTGGVPRRGFAISARVRASFAGNVLPSDILPLFQGTRIAVVFAWSCMGILLGYRGRGACATGYSIKIRSAFERPRVGIRDWPRVTGRDCPEADRASR